MKSKLLLAVLALSIVFTACKKNKGEEPAQDPFKLGYSNLTVEEHKKELETSGLDFITKINTLPEEKFIKVMKNLSNLNLELESNNVNSLMAISKGASNKNLAAILETATETQKLSDEYGIYTYNSTTQTCTKTASSNVLELRFPALENGTVNNAILTMSYVSSNIITTAGEDSIELPKSASTILLVDGVEEIKFTSSHEYKVDGTPTKTDVNLRMGTFTFAFNVANNGSVLTNGFSLSKSNELLFGFNSTVNGNTNWTNINDSGDASDIVTNANASFEVMNIKFVGLLNVKGLMDAEASIDSTANDQVINNKKVEALNANSKFVVINKTNNTIIAKTEFVAVSDENCYTNYYNNQQICYTEHEAETRLIFKDGSKLSFEAFKETGFAKLIDEIETYSDKF